MKTIIVIFLTVLLGACAVVPLDPYYEGRGHYMSGPGPRRQHVPPHDFHRGGHAAPNGHYGHYGYR